MELTKKEIYLALFIGLNVLLSGCIDSTPPITTTTIFQPDNKLDIGLYYVWHYDDDFDIYHWNWIGNGLYESELYLTSYNNQIYWEYTGLEDIKVDYPIGHNQALPSYSDMRTIIYEIRQKATAFDYYYNHYDMIIFVFANTREAYSVDYSSPIYMSEETLTDTNRKILVSHEILHTFNCFDGEGGNKCITAYLGLDAIICQSCLDKFKMENYKKIPLGEW